MVDPKAVGDAFLDQFAALAASGSAEAMSGLYGDDTLMSTDGSNFRGKASIAGHLAAKFAGGPIGLRYSARDALPSMTTGGIMVFATGELAQGAGRCNFQAAFMLFPTAAGGLYVRNEIFRCGPGAAPLNDAAGGELAKTFVGRFFEIFDSDRSGLAAIYRPTSFVLFEGNMAQGPQAAIELLVKMPGARHAIETLDSQPIQDKVTNVLVTGKLVLEGQTNPLNFAQLFQIVIDESGAHVACDMFRLNYG